MMKNIIIINPESVFKLVWDGFMLFLLVFNIFYIPLKIAFEESGGLSNFIMFISYLKYWQQINSLYFHKKIIIFIEIAKITTFKINLSRD